MTVLPHITVCVCTFKRAALLTNLFQRLESQRTDGLFTHDLVIADNDRNRSAERVVRELAAKSSMRVTYCVEPEQNIALARNLSVAQSGGDLLAFVDDDEEPSPNWLYELFQARLRYSVDGVLGPVLPRFEGTPPRWVTKGGFFDRPRHPTGSPVSWPEARTGNVLVAKAAVGQLEIPFRSQFGSGGEDVDFFRRLMAVGRTFVWCDEAEVYEFVPPYRCTRRFHMRRALLRGSIFPKLPGRRFRNIAKSLIAVPLYALALPLLAVIGHHLFMSYLIKLLDHAARLLAVAGLRLSTERET